MRYGRSNICLINSSNDTQKAGISINMQSAHDRILNGRNLANRGNNSANTVRSATMGSPRCQNHSLESVKNVIRNR